MDYKILAEAFCLLLFVYIQNKARALENITSIEQGFFRLGGLCAGDGKPLDDARHYQEHPECYHHQA